MPLLKKNKVVDVDPVTDPVSCVSTSTVTQDQSIVCEWIGLTMIVERVLLIVEVDCRPHTH